MNNNKVGDTYNFALVGHSGDGKTSLGEAILHTAGATHELGSVIAGTSSLNFLPEERERHTTISSSIYGFDWNEKHLTLVDTPGDSNFQADGRVALGGLDGAVLVLSGVDGAKVGSQRMFRHCREHGIPVIAFLNGMDRDRADFGRAVETLQEMGANPAVIAMPIGTGDGFQGCIDLLRDKAVTAAGESDVPGELADAVTAAREALTESVAECDDALLEKYLEEGELGEEELVQALLRGTREGKITPVLCGAALAELGVPILLRAVSLILPSAADAPPRSTSEGDPVEPSAEGPLSALVIKTLIDRYAGTLSVLRIVSGKLEHDSSVLSEGDAVEAKYRGRK